MTVFDIARRAARSLRNAKARTILTSLAIAVGAFTITVSLAAGEGAREYADKLIGSNINPQALFIVKDKTIFDGSERQAPLRRFDTTTGNNQGMTIKQMTQADIDTLSRRDDIAYVIPTYSPDMQYMTFGDTSTKFVSALTTYDPSLLSEVSSGSLPGLNQQIGDTEVIVPGVFVDTLIKEKIIKSEADLIGKRLTLTATKAAVTPSADAIAQAFATGGEAAVQALVSTQTKAFTFTVRGVTKKSATALQTSTALQISAQAAREMSEYTTAGTPQYQKYFAATAVVADGYDPAAVRDALAHKEFYAKTAKDLQSVVFTVVNTLQGIVIGFGVIALIASIFGIINTQYISVLERTREIGLMKALGMRGGSVSRLFQFEAAWIGFLGGVIGSAVAVIAGVSLNPWITEKLSLGEGNAILVFQPLPIAIMVVALIVIAMLAGWFPARRAAKLDPIEALRTE